MDRYIFGFAQVPTTVFPYTYLREQQLKQSVKMFGDIRRGGAARKVDAELAQRQYVSAAITVTIAQQIITVDCGCIRWLRTDRFHLIYAKDTRIEESVEQ